MNETVKNTVKTVMLEGIDPETTYKFLDGVKGVDSVKLHKVIQEVSTELAEQGIINWNRVGA